MFRERLRRHPGEIKSTLTNQAFLAGIGNAYADEILLRCPHLPVSPALRAVADDVERLYRGDAGRCCTTPSPPCAQRVGDDITRRYATSCRCTARQGSRARAAARRSPRCRPTSASPTSAGTASRHPHQANMKTEITRSKRRKSTVSARLDGDTLIVQAPQVYPRPSCKASSRSWATRLEKKRTRRAS